MATRRKYPVSKSESISKSESVWKSESIVKPESTNAKGGPSKTIITNCKSIQTARWNQVKAADPLC